MILHHLKPAFQDNRGQITDIIQHTPFDSVSVITCVKGAIRGNHFHKESIQYSYVLSGRMRALTQPPDGTVETADLFANDLLESPPFERHALQALEDSVLIIITRGPRGGKDYEDDTFRVSPLQPDNDSN
jgi:oxalate decarboxylase/phosphoglucose isomerase-like protein (cupin superfamily)